MSNAKLLVGIAVHNDRDYDWGVHSSTLVVIKLEEQIPAAVKYLDVSDKNIAIRGRGIAMVVLRKN